MRSDVNRWARLPGEVSATWHKRLKAADRTSLSADEVHGLRVALGQASRARLRDVIGGPVMMADGLIALATGLGVVPDSVRRLAGPVGQSPWSWTAALAGASIAFILVGWLISDSRPNPWKSKGKR